MTPALAASSQVEKSSWEDFNPTWKQLQVDRARRLIDGELAATFFELLESGQIPRFVLEEVDVEMMGLAAQ